MSFDTKSLHRAFMVTVHKANMHNIGLKDKDFENPEYVAEVLSIKWNESAKDRTCAVTVCESAEGLFHAHMACYGNSTTINCVSKTLGNSHVEPQLGGKKALKDYILKEGKYAEKGEKILYVKDIDKIQDVQGNRNDMDVIQEMLDRGKSPQEILDSNIHFYRYKNTIIERYKDMRIKELPRHIDVYVEYHVGESGTGKTYTYDKLCEEYGDHKIYPLNDFDNNASGGMDEYIKIGAPPILFIDEFKGVGLAYGKLLTMLNGYTRFQTHSRFTNTYNLWEKVYITSVYPPEELYNIMVTPDKRTTDTYKQFIRRINKIVYHYIENNEYKIYTIDAKDYTDYDDLKNRAMGKDGFMQIPNEEYEQLAFD